jgi:hypothetical protein
MDWSDQVARWGLMWSEGDIVGGRKRQIEAVDSNRKELRELTK